MKKLWLILGVLALASACSEKESEEARIENLPLEEALEEGEQVVVQPKYDISFTNEAYSYDISNLALECDKGSDIICAIDLTLKCTINHKAKECTPAKMPKFVFMEDESLQRPTKIEFKIEKIKPIDANMLEVYTKSTCNGGWFGLCQGNIIYVLNNKNGNWVVKDIYAMDNF